MYILSGHLVYPILPTPITFEAKLAPLLHFRTEDCDALVKYCMEVVTLPPPMDYIGPPRLEGGSGKACETKESNLGRALEHNYPLTLQTCELTQTIKDEIVHKFKSINHPFMCNHYVRKELVLGTVI